MVEGKGFLFFACVLLLVSLFMIYWFVPFQETYFISTNANTNFSTSNSSQEQMQFYSDMRFLSNEISYKIEECPLNKKARMEQAFDIISNETILSFYPVSSDQEISVTCQSTNKFKGDLFIAGEGGPMEIVSSGEYNVIHTGAILLIRDSECEIPNVEIHELLHVLGFEHSSNPNNILYNITKCGQKIGEDVLIRINELYSIPAYTDLSLENVSVFMHGRYLNSNFTVKNIGLKDSETFEVRIYADDKLVDTADMKELEIGTGMRITLENVFVNHLSVKEIKLLANYPLQELEKNNNEIILKVKS